MHVRSLFLLVLIAACAPPSPVATRRDSAGVEIVMNSGIDRILDLSVRPLDTLFDPARDTALQGDAQKLQVATDGAGRLVFADGVRGDRRVLRREGDGTFRQIGRHGAGPGEYGLVGGIGVAPSGAILVVDYTQEGYLRFDDEGRPLPILRWSQIGRGFARTGAYLAGGLVAQLTDMGAADGGESAPRSPDGEGPPRTKQTLYLLTATDTSVIARLEEPPMTMARFEGCGVGYSQPPLFFPSLLWTGNHEMVAVTADGGYRIDVWRGGRLARSIRRESTPRAVTRTLAEQELAPGMTINFGPRAPCLIEAAEMVAKQGFAPTLPAIKRLSMAADGTLWVERYTFKGEPLLRDLFDPTGAYLGTLRGDAPWPQAWLPSGEYVSVAANKDSLPVVVKYGVGGAVRRE